MKTGRSIQDTYREIMRQTNAKADYLVNTSRIVMETCDREPMLRVTDNEGVDLVEPMDIRPTAHVQISNYLSIPKKYYDRMQTEEPELLAHNVNTWFRKQPEQRMIRTMDGHARAFLSNRYRRIDNLDIARVTIPIIADIPGARYRSPDFVHLDPLMAIANLVEPEYQKKINKRVQSRLRVAHLRGCPQELSSCIDSAEREYLPRGITETLSSLDFIGSGMNLCILGPSDSGKS